MLPTIIKLLPLLLLAQGMIYGGVFFISGQLLPATLANIYTITTPFTRMLIALVLVFSIGNLLMGYAYEHWHAGLVTPLTVFATITVQIIFTVFILSIKPSLMLIPATGVVIIGCLWVNYILTQSS